MFNTPLRRALSALSLCLMVLPQALAGELDDHVTSAQQLQGLLSSARLENRAMPRMADPAVAPLFGTLLDRKRFLDARPLTQQDLGPTLKMCMSISPLVFTYLGNEKDEADTTPAEHKAIVERTVTYQDEVARLFEYQGHCMAKLVPLMENIAAATPAEQMTPKKLGGLQQVRQGFVMTFAEVTAMTLQPGITGKNKDVLYATMAATSPSFAMTMDLSTRKQLTDSLHKVSPTLPAVYALQMQRLIKLIETAPCNHLCKL